MTNETKRNPYLQDWVSSVEVGDMLRISPDWNKSSGPKRHFNEFVEVLDIDDSNVLKSESGVKFLVADKRGLTHYLDSNWFLGFR